MDQQTLLYVMTAFVVIAGLALVIQAGLLFGIYRTSKAMHERFADLLPKIESLMSSTQRSVEQSRKQIVEVAGKANQILDITRAQLAKVEEILGDATTRARVQMERAELVLDDAMNRAQETIALVHNGVTRPLREIQAVTTGLRTALAYLMRGGRPSVAQATHDEEMFI